MSKKIDELIEQLRKCPLSDNSVDYLKEELELQEKYNWLDDNVIDIEIPELIKLSNELGDFWNMKEDKMNEWDVQYDELCTKIIGQLNRWYEDYHKDAVQHFKEPLEFDDWVKLGPCETTESCISDIEIKKIEAEIVDRLNYPLKLYSTEDQNIYPLFGIDCCEKCGLFHIYVSSDGDYIFPQTVLPILYPSSEEFLSEETIFMGKKCIPLEEYKKFSGNGTYEHLITTHAGYLFMKINNIDYNNLLNEGLAISAQTLKEAYDPC